jgi:hypothetical protein
VCNYTALLQTVLTFPASSLGFVLPQEGALAYGLKLDDRVRVLPNAKLRASREWLCRWLERCADCRLVRRRSSRRHSLLPSLPLPRCVAQLLPPCPPAFLGLQWGACGPRRARRTITALPWPAISRSNPRQTRPRG